MKKDQNITKKEELEMPECFGTVWDANAPECQMCACETDCKAAFFAAKPEEIEEIKAGIVAELIEDVTVEAKEAIKEEEEAKAGLVSELIENPAPASSEKKKAPASTVIQAAFRKNGDGKLDYLPDYDFAGKTPDDVVIINAGDKVKVLSPRSKFKDQILEVRHYAVKYECIRCNVEGQKFTADFASHLVELC